MNLFFLITYEYFVGSESGCFEKSDPVKKKTGQDPQHRFFDVQYTNSNMPLD